MLEQIQPLIEIRQYPLTFPTAKHSPEHDPVHANPLPPFTFFSSFSLRISEIPFKLIFFITIITLK